MLTEPGRPVVLDGRYELVGQVGRGGMGTVHQAVDHRLRRTVAVKLLSEELAHHPSSRERFQREAHAVATLNHPSIATIYDVGERRIGVDRQPYFVMEYVDGVTLAELQRAGEFPVEQAVAVACQVLDALEHSHRHGIVHRDIKPSNIMLGDPPTVKVLDFGIAKALSDAATLLTGNGVALGTPAYSAPEQIRGGSRIDHRADLYAVGCLLYELLAGQPPFGAESTFALLHKQLYAESVPVSRHRPQTSPIVEAVIGRALRKDPEERYPDAATMRAELAQALATPDLPVVVTTPPGVRNRDSQPTEVLRPPREERPTEVFRRPVVHSRTETFQPEPEQDALPDPLPMVPQPVTRARSVMRHLTVGGPAFVGCMLALMCARGHVVDTAHFAWVAGVAGVLGLVLLPFSPRAAGLVAWGPVAEAFAINSGFRRLYVGWDSTYVGIALLLVVAALLCLAAAVRSREAASAVVAFWLTATCSLWFFLDDLRKLFVFYVLWGILTLAALAHEVLGRRGRRPARTAAGPALSPVRRVRTP